MKQLIIIAITAIIMGGCATQQQSHYGDFSTQKHTGLNQLIVEDAIDRLTKSFAVGKTTFKMNAKTLDHIGVSIEEGLRELGFGVSYQEGKSLDYIFDDYPSQTKDYSSHRLTLVVEGTRLSRRYVYDAKRNQVAKGAWTIVEGGEDE